MEIKPIIKYTLPKFAMALTAAAVAGTMTACTAHKVFPEVEGMGIAPQPAATGVALGGDAPVIEQPAEALDFTGAIREANRIGEGCEKELLEGFARQGIELERNESSSLWIWKSKGQPQIYIEFFDGDAESNGVRARDYMEQRLDPACDRQEWWGFVQVRSSAEDGAEMRLCSIDVRCCEGMTIERAAQIAEAVLN